MAICKPLTAQNIRTAKPGDVLRDETVPGLHLRFFPTKAVYYVYFRTKMVKTNGKPQERRLRLGAATQAFTIPEARRLAARALLDVANGTDPAMTKRHQPDSKTLDDLFELAMKYHWSDEKYVKSKWAKFVRDTYDRCLKKRFGARPASDPFDDVEAWHAEYKDRPYMGNRALGILSTVLNLGEKATYGRLRPLNSNPCSAVTKHKEAKRGVFATPKELAAIGPLLNKYAELRPAPVAFIYLLLFSGSRPSAIERATRDQISEVVQDGQVWGVLKGFQGKTADEVVWLPPQAMAVIRRLPKAKTLTGIKMPHKFWYMIRKEAGCEHVRMRDLRRTFATVGMSHGQAMAVISEVLNHKTTQTTKVYAKLTDDKARSAAGAIAGHMEGLLRGEVKSSLKAGSN